MISQDEYNKLLSLDSLNVCNKEINNGCVKNPKTEKIECEDEIIETRKEITTDKKERMDNHTPKEIEKMNLSEEDIIMGDYLNVLNIYTVYFKTLYGKDEQYALLDEINRYDDTSTNLALEMFYEELKIYQKASDERYKKVFDIDEYKKMYLTDEKSLPDDYNTYIIQVEDEEKMSHSLIMALFHIAKFENWYQIKWSINKVNTF